jgi:Zn-dependent M28 family amino/carboxypeptidase
MNIEFKKLNKRVLKGSAYLLSAGFIMGGLCSRSQIKQSPQIIEKIKGISIDVQQAKKDLQIFTKYPHPFGSNRQNEIRLYIKKQLANSSFQVFEQSFSVDVPNDNLSSTNQMAASTVKKSGVNLIALPKAPKKGCLVLLGSHYDSKYLKNQISVGANDSGSSSAALLHLARQDKILNQGICDLGFVWFDGEEAVLFDWSAGEKSHRAKIQDNTYGSRYLAQSLAKCDDGFYCLPKKWGALKLTSLVLLDMVGSKNIKLSKDGHSHKALLQSALEAADNLGQSELFTKTTKSIEDDHVPFLKLGIPCLNLIDFENTQHWHRPSDTIQHISYKSIEIASAIALATALQTPEDIKDFTP